MIHEGGASIETGAVAGTELAFLTADGVRLPALPPAEVVEDAVTRLRIWAAERGLDMGPDTALPWWDGSVPDYDLAISSLLDNQVPLRRECR